MSGTKELPHDYSIRRGREGLPGMSHYRDNPEMKKKSARGWVGRQRASGKCTSCAADAEPFRTMCGDHRRKRRRWWANRLDRDRMCVQCGVRPRAGGTQNCTPCRNIRKASSKARYLLLRSLGLCTTCQAKTRSLAKCQRCIHRDNTKRRERALEEVAG